MTTEVEPTSSTTPEATPSTETDVRVVDLPTKHSASNSSDATPEGSAPVAPLNTWVARAIRLFKVIVRFLLKVSARILFYLSPLILLGMYVGWRELKTSRWQAYYLSRIASDSTFVVGEGVSPSIHFPDHGPYDERLGYTRIPAIIDNLTKAGYTVAKQARWSEWLLWLAKNGINPTYREKTRAGITILDRKSTTIYAAYRPERIYETFEEIPRLILEPLLFIENREILDPNSPNRNPAVEWDRLGKAVLEKIAQIFKPDINAPGGSTIATQLEKYRHSKEGRTGSVKDKFQQMASASLRAYMYGEETTQTRKQIILQYINSIPLAALPGFGEVNGLGDGLWAWYGEDFNAMNLALRQADAAPRDADPAQFAQPFKEALSLFIAHRRPSYYLLSGVSELNALTNAHIDLLSREGVISPALAVRAKAVDLTLRRAAPKPPRISYLQRKAANAIRTRLLQLTDYPKLYDLDQLDVSVRSTMDNEANEAVTETLQKLKDPESIKKLGLTGHRTLDQGDPSKVIYSVTLYERRGNANLLRVQTDNFDKPFSINEGTRLDLGSTAKLRTLVTYLDVFGYLYDKYHNDTPAALKSELAKRPDPLTEFAITTFLRDPKTTLPQLLDMAMERRYSANPGESFFTGGGLHTFENFNKEDNGRNPTVEESLAASINLPFIRIMRDIVKHHMFRMGLSLNVTEGGNGEDVRVKFLRKFADQEGLHFLKSFYAKYRGRPSEELLPLLVKSSRASARHAAAMFRFVHPDGTVDELDEFLREHLRSTNLSLTLVEQLYQEFVPGRYDINDQGYLARVHPLELWLVRYLTHHPNATLTAASEASAEARQQVYKWLFSPKLRRAQDTRIRNLIETEAFHQIHKQWKRTGYPFSSMVPSLASSIGSSGDRPAALAELVGIILNDGVRLPLVRLEELHFGANTPYETLLRRDGSTLNQAERVLKSEVARRLRKAMVSVVERGTARRVFGAYKRSDGASYVIGGKTGTGDHRHESYGPGGRLIASRVVNRTATFAFFIGDRFFGVISAHVPGADAAKFHFTSALAAELLKIVSPSLAPILEQQENGLTPILDPRDPPPGSATPPTKGSAAAKPKETTPPPTPKTAATSAAVKPTARAANSPAKVAQEPERVAAPPKVVPPTAPPPSVAKQPKTAAPSLPIIIPPPL